MMLIVVTNQSIKGSSGFKFDRSGYNNPEIMACNNRMASKVDNPVIVFLLIRTSSTPDVKLVMNNALEWKNLQQHEKQSFQGIPLIVKIRFQLFGPLVFLLMIFGYLM